jgi:hypothetical protein
VKVLAVLAGLFGFLCMVMGIIVLLGTFPELGALPEELTWDVWFWLSALLFLASIASNMGGRRGGGGEEF